MSILARKRFQLAGALVIGALLPWAARAPLPGLLFEAATLNGLVGNAIAIVIGFWMRLSIETYPGIRRSSVILPAALTGHGLVVTWFVLTRFPYDRLGLAAGFLLHVSFLYALGIYTDRRVRRRIAVVPIGGTARIDQIDSIDWVMLKRARLSDARGCNAIVADFGADLPDEWEAFLADAALDGRIVYQVKQLAESLTGRVELEHLSENSFGSLLPARGYFYLKGPRRLPLCARDFADCPAGHGGDRACDPARKPRARAVQAEAGRARRPPDHRLQVSDHAAD